jgi:hypothetical protein
MNKHRTAPLRRHAAEHWPLALAASALACGLLPLALNNHAQAQPAAAMASTEWPSVWDGQPLRPLALSDVEQRFADQFPGRIARFALADRRELVLREVNRPTRMLHPAADCWRGIGWRIEATRLQADARADLWRCFEASRPGTGGGSRVRVCERIVDAQGRAFTDTSAWFWAASLGQSAGPWQAVTRVEGL